MVHSNPKRSLESSIIKYSPLVWLLGVSALAYQLAAAASLWKADFRIRRPSLIQSILIAYCLVYATSISVATMQGADLMRVLAALYNLSIWIMGIVIFSAADLGDWSGTRRAARTALAVLFVAGVLAYMAFGSQGSVRWNSLLGMVVNVDSLPENLAANTSLHFTSADWSTMGIGSRLSLMAPYPTAMGMLALVLLSLSAPETTGTRSLVRYAPYFFFCVVLTFLSASRAAMACTVLFGGLLVLFQIARSVRTRFFKIFLIFAAASAALGGAAFLNNQAESAWNSVNQTRAESSSLRFELYSRSISSALEEHPALGFGVKERNSIFVIPLGSHSTVVGSMYKTGLIGLTIVALLFAAIVFVSLRTGFSTESFSCAAHAAGSIAMLPLLVFEDIDAIPLVAYLFFLGLAMMEKGAQERMLK